MLEAKVTRRNSQRGSDLARLISLFKIDRTGGRGHTSNPSLRIAHTKWHNSRVTPVSIAPSSLTLESCTSENPAGPCASSPSLP